MMGSITRVCPTFCHPILPAVFDDSLSYVELVCKIQAKVNELIKKDNAMGDELNVVLNDIDELQELLNSIKDGYYAELYIDQLRSYIDNHLVEFVARLTKYVFPTFYWDGECWRFALDVPCNWDFLKFSWIFPDDLTWHIGLDY